MTDEVYWNITRLECKGVDGVVLVVGKLDWNITRLECKGYIDDIDKDIIIDWNITRLECKVNFFSFAFSCLLIGI